MSEHGLLSPGELEEALDGMYSYEHKAADAAEVRVRAHIDALEAALQAARRERGEARADNAALLALVRAPAGELASAVPCWWCSGIGHHAALCPGGRAARSPHPGAALLEEHRSALVRAYNEGLEAAAGWIEINGMGNPEGQAFIIRARKKPEP